MRAAFWLTILALTALVGCGRSIAPNRSLDARGVAAVDEDFSLTDGVSEDLNATATEVSPGEFVIVNNGASFVGGSTPTGFELKKAAAWLAPQAGDKQTVTPKPTNASAPAIAKLDAKKLKISERLLNEAMAEYAKVRPGLRNQRYIGITDFSIPSSEKRFWLIDLKTGEAIHRLHVSHGKGSGSKLHAKKFSNTLGSEASSIGTYVTTVAYKSKKHGSALRLRGMSDTNSNAEKRNIVIHGASYLPIVDEFGKIFVRPVLGVGRSQGCFAFSHNANKIVIKTLGSGAFLYAGLSNPKTATQLK